MIPAGVAPEVWGALTPAERAEFGQVEDSLRPATVPPETWEHLAHEERLDVAKNHEAIYGGESLHDFMLRMAPHHPPPEHLLPLIDIIEEARVNRLMKVAISLPPGHAKTTLFLNAFAWWLTKFPADTCAYNSFNAGAAFGKSVLARDLAIRAGVELSDDTNNKAEWRTTAGGGLLAGGLESLTGKRVQGPLVIDDPYSGHVDASSPAYRDEAWNAMMSVAMTRREGAPLFLVHCVAAGEPVMMADGSWKQIESVRPGEDVTAYDGGRFVSRRVLAQRSSGLDDLLKVSTARKTLRVNHRHPFLREDGTWVKAGDLRAGEKVIVAVGAPTGQAGDEDFAWFFGFMMGDGWVTRWRRRNRDRKRGKTYESESLCVCAALSKDEALNDRVIDAMERHLGARPKRTRFGYARLDRNAAGRRLIDLGLVGGAHGKRIPEWVFRMSRPGRIAYLRGHAAADGHRLKKTTDGWRISSVSRDLVEDLRRLAVSAGLRAGRICSFRQTIRAPNSREAKPYECFGVFVNFALPPDVAEKITAIEPDGRAEVFDLTVDGAENFVAGGFVVHNTRWHEDDSIGRIKNLKLEGWRIVNLPALDENGRALWEAMYPAKDLLAIKSDVGEYVFASLFQGEPRPRGGAVFGSPTYYDPATFKIDGWRLVLAGDPAASTRTSADYSAAGVLAVRGHGAEREANILYAYRKQVPIPQFATDLLAMQNQFGQTAINVESVGGFKAIPQMLLAIHPDLRINEIIPVGDKFTRAQPSAAAWNTGRLRVPADAPPWLGPFLDEVTRFTGVNDKHDDQVDWLAHAWNSADGKMSMAEAYGTENDGAA